MRTLSILALAIIIILTIGCGTSAKNQTPIAASWLGTWSGTNSVWATSTVTLTITAGTGANTGSDVFSLALTSNGTAANGAITPCPELSCSVPNAAVVDLSYRAENGEGLQTGEWWLLNGNTITEESGDGLYTVRGTLTKQ
jgi:hypothetical protein